MKAEIDALKEKNTWEIVRRPKNTTVVDCRWVYKVKWSHDGSEAKLKSRLVARGFNQEYGVNYFDTYAPVVKNSSVRLLMALAVKYELKVEQIDIRNAYVNSVLEEEVYMEQPEGFCECDQREYVCKLKRSLYGLKQSGNSWNKCLNTCLVAKLGFSRLKTDSCIYVKRENSEIVLLAIYVDDIIIYAPTSEVIDRIKSQIAEEFEVDDIGDCKKVIGMNVECHEGEIKIHQKALVEQLLKETGFTDCRTRRTPLDPGKRLLRCTIQDEEERKKSGCGVIDQTEFRSIIGKFNYLASTTRPDLSYAVSYLSQFIQCPHAEHTAAAEDVLRYLAGTPSLGLTFRRRPDMKLVGYVDADWAQCPIDRRSYSGHIMMMSGGPVAWESKKQPTTALSSTEAEYMALTSGAKELVFLAGIIMELGLELDERPTINCDNQGAIKLARNNGYSPRTKHIDVRHHYIRELLEENVLELNYVPSAENLADIFTKPLGRCLHEKFVDKLIRNV